MCSASIISSDNNQMCCYGLRLTGTNIQVTHISASSRHIPYAAHVVAFRSKQQLFAWQTIIVGGAGENPSGSLTGSELTYPCICFEIQLGATLTARHGWSASYG